MATRNKRAKISLDTAQMTVTYQPFNAAGELDGRSITLSPLNYPEQIRNLLMLDRLRNKAMDAYSDPDADVIEAVRGVDEQLLAGNWSQRGTGESAERTTLFVEAYARFTYDMPKQGKEQGLSIEEWTANRRSKVNEIEAGDDEALKAMLKNARSHAGVKKLMAEITLEKARERAKSANAAAKAAKEEEVVLI